MRMLGGDALLSVDFWSPVGGDTGLNSGDTGPCSGDLSSPSGGDADGGDADLPFTLKKLASQVGP